MAIKVNGNTVIDNTEAATLTDISITSNVPKVILKEADRTAGVDQLSRFVASSGITYIQAEGGDIRFAGYNNVTLPQSPKVLINSVWEPILHGNSNITIGSASTLDVSGGTLTLASDQIAGDKVAIATFTTRGTVEKATNLEADSGVASNKYMDTVRTKRAIDTQVPALLNSSGSAPMYACRAWADIDGSTGSIRASGNIASVTRISTGKYDVTFSTAMSSTAYAVSATARYASSSHGTTVGAHTLLTTGFSIETWNTASTRVDPAYLLFSVFQ